MGTVSWTRGSGPLVPFAEGFWRELLRLGHPPGGTKHHLVLMGQLNRWLSGEGLGVGELTPAVAGEFLASRRAAGQRRVPTLAALAPLFDYLRGQRLLALEQPGTPTRRDELLARYRRHLVHGRGLTPVTVLRYERFAGRFLTERASRTGSETGAEGLTSAEVSEYMLQASSRLVVESAKREAADLRALLRFLYLDGILGADLGGAMPPVVAWRGARLPAGPAFFMSSKGTPVIYTDFGTEFRKVVTLARVGETSPMPPRIHDLRHSFAVHTLVRWYQAGEDVGALLPRLSTYLGHLAPGYTYWYLSAAPELLALAAARLEKVKGVRG